MKSDFYRAIEKHQSAFDIRLDEETIRALENFYFGVMKNNEHLHLVGKSDAEEFAVRHILESLYALRFLPENSFFADIGAGAGLPSIPCLIVRPDLKAVLIESKKKKCEFLEKAVKLCGLSGRATVVHKQLSEADDPGVSHILCRAIDGFSKKVPKLLKWSEKADLVFFAGESVRKALRKTKSEFEETLLPMSERRFVFYVSRKNNEEKRSEPNPIQTPPILLDETNLLEL